MRKLRHLLVAAGLLAFVSAGFAQEAKEPEKGGEAKGEGNLQVWKWANFVVLAGGLGYLAGKNGGKFFGERSRQIRDEIAEATAAREKAEAAAAEAERRLAGLEADLAALREEFRKETEAEAERAAKQMEADVARIHLQAEQEIAATVKSARAELKGYSARLAVALAEDKIRSRMSPDVQAALVADFASDLESSLSKSRTN